MYIHLRDYMAGDNLGNLIEREEVFREEARITERQKQILEELGAENAKMDMEWEPGMKLPERAIDKQIGGEHYKRMDIQPWDVVDFGPREQAIGFYRYNALKYIMRAGTKGEFKEDVAKAQHYLEKLLEIL